ncbi:MAG: ATP-binding protein [Algoriphagus sp.]|nr:ATP-binding protein [Algoriphagus sp.]
MQKLAFGFLMLLMTAFPAMTSAQLNPNNLESFSELKGVNVLDIMPDSFGYIWMATQNGLIRYDGYEFKRYYYNPNDSTSIQTIVTWSLHEDRKGNIWIGCLDYAYKYDPLKNSFSRLGFTHLLNRPAYESFGVWAMAEDTQGRMYFGANSNYGNAVVHQSLMYLDEGKGEIKLFESPQGLEIQNISSLLSDNRGEVWIAANNGFFKIDTNRKLSKIELPQEFENGWANSYNFQLGLDPTGTVLLTTANSSIFEYDPKKNSFRQYSLNPLIGDGNKSMTINHVAADTTGLIWLATERGLVTFDRVQGKLNQFKENPASESKIEKAGIYKLVFDSFGNLWLSSASLGAFKYENRAIFASFGYNPEEETTSLTPGWVNCIYEGSDGEVWVNTNAGLNRWNPTTHSLKRFPYQINFPGVWVTFGFFETNPGEFYLGTNLGAFKFTPATGKTEKLSLPGVADTIEIYQFHLDKKDNFWLATRSGLFKRTKGSEAFIRYDLSTLPEANFTSNEIRGVFESDKYGLWLITNNGLFLYNDQKDQIERHGYDKRLGDVFVTQDINSFFEDSMGVAWVGTWEGGLSRYDVEKREIKTYTTSDGLPSMSIQGILYDEKNKALWLSTFDGLSRFDLAISQFNNYTIADGIQGQLFADGAFLKTSRGLFLFGGSDGVTYFDPNQITKNSIPPKVLLTDFKINNRSIFSDPDIPLTEPIFRTNQITLPFKKNNISIDFLAIHYSDPAKNKYAYKLENYEDDWREVGNQRTAFYSNLPPGDYLFRVKAANSNGVWNEEGVSIKLVITPPWWRTGWAFAAYGLLFLIGVRVVHVFQKQRVIRLERAKAHAKEIQQAKEIEKAYETLKATQAQLIQAEKMASLGILTSGIAHEIQNPLNFVNNFSEVSQDLIKEIKTERTKPQNQRDVALEEEILDVLAINLEKITLHGKRADSIVKSMVEHSRTSSGNKELTDINALIESSLQLAYHGYCSKEKNCTCELKTILDETIPKVNIIPQDIGRVLLNVFNNAFYAVNEKLKSDKKGYKPLVRVTSKYLSKSLKIAIFDNGIGIPPEIKDKIFNPFFTTKPNGKGTGLGLSLAYDIMKAHGGEIKAESELGKGATFTLTLPLS